MRELEDQVEKSYNGSEDSNYLGDKLHL